MKWRLIVGMGSCLLIVFPGPLAAAEVRPPSFPTVDLNDQGMMFDALERRWQDPFFGGSSETAAGDSTQRSGAIPDDAIPPPDQLPPIGICLKAGRDGRLETIKLGLRDLGPHPAILFARVREILGDGDPAGYDSVPDLEFELIFDSRLRFRDLNRVLAGLASCLGPWRPYARWWFSPEMPPEKRKRWQWVSTVHFMLGKQGEAVAKTLVKHRVAPDSDIAKLAAGIITHAEAAKASGRKVRVVLHGDEKLESRFWLQLVALLADKCALTAIERVDLVCGSGESSHRLSLYEPRSGRGFHDGEWEMELD